MQRHAEACTFEELCRQTNAKEVGPRPENSCCRRLDGHLHTWKRCNAGKLGTVALHCNILQCCMSGLGVAEKTVGVRRMIGVWESTQRRPCFGQTSNRLWTCRTDMPNKQNATQQTEKGPDNNSFKNMGPLNHAYMACKNMLKVWGGHGVVWTTAPPRVKLLSQTSNNV